MEKQITALEFEPICKVQDALLSALMPVDILCLEILCLSGKGIFSLFLGLYCRAARSDW